MYVRLIAARSTGLCVTSVEQPLRVYKNRKATSLYMTIHPVRYAIVYGEQPNPRWNGPWYNATMQPAEIYEQNLIRWTEEVN